MSNDKELNDAAVAWGICEEGEALNAAKLNWFMNSRKGNDSIKAEGIREVIQPILEKKKKVTWSTCNDVCSSIRAESRQVERGIAIAVMIMVAYADKLEGKQ